MDELYQNLVRLSPKEQVPFRCIGCGECCRHVHMQVPVEALDAFRIVKHLQQQGEDIACMDDFWIRYTEPALLNECGFFVYFLNTQGRRRPAFSCRIIDAESTRSIRELAGYIHSLWIRRKTADMSIWYPTSASSISKGRRFM